MERIGEHEMKNISDKDKRRIIKIVLKQCNGMVSNGFTDSTTLYYKDGEFVVEEWSPRENMTYSDEVVSLEKAWKIVNNSCSYELKEAVKKYYKSKG